MTCVRFARVKFALSRRKFVTVWPPNPSQMSLDSSQGRRLAVARSTFLRSGYKQLLDEAFVISRIIKDGWRYGFSAEA